MNRSTMALLGIGLAFLSFAGCGETVKRPEAAKAPKEPEAKKIVEVVVDDVAEERAKLSPEDRALVNAQEWCAISNDGRLGSMGAPIKLVLNGQPVFLCCKRCTRRAEADPEKTLAKVEELKAKAKKGG